MRTTPFQGLVLLSAALFGVAAAAPLAAAESDADNGMTIDHWGSMLMVTAPDNRQDPMVMRQLGAHLTMDVVDSPISEVVDFLHRATGVNMVMDPGLRTEDPHVTLKVADMSLDAVLHWVTTTAHCSWAAVDGAVFFSQKPIQGAQRTVLYDVSDLLMAVQDFPGPQLAFNAGTGGAAIGMFKQAQEPAQEPPTLDTLEDFLRKTLATQGQP